MSEHGSDDEMSEEDLEVMHITACKEKKAQLLAERERREETIERMQVKLKALNSELAARNEEVMTLQQQNSALMKMSERDTKPAAADGIEETPTAAREHKIRRFMEEQLKEKASQRSARNDFGMRVFDEMELMVSKPPEEQQREMSYIDTVLVTWSRGPGADQTDNLTYRVDRNMTSKKLREDACFYWGISEVDYILKTVTTNSKVQDDVTIQNCFKPNEDAHLMLVHKTPTTVRPSQEELKAIRAKMGLKRKVKDKEAGGENGKPTAAAQSADFIKQLDDVPGFKEFMLQRDQDERGHLPGLKLSSICLFLTLAVSTVFVLFTIRPQNIEHISTQGVLSAITAPHTNAVTGTALPGFHEIASLHGVWTWLEYRLGDEVFSRNSHLRDDNYLPGWVWLRMQRVKPGTAEECENSGGLPLPGEACAAPTYDSDTADRQDLEAVKAKWVNLTGVDGRSSTLVPWKFLASDESERILGGTGIQGSYFSTDASGYYVAYNMQPANLTATRAAFHSDMGLLRELGWLDPSTRALEVAFAAYNGNHDYWLSATFTLEVSAVGVLFPKAMVYVFKPQFMDHDWVRVFIVDAVRLCMIIYICTWHLYQMILHQSRKTPGKPFYQRVTLCMLVDVLLGADFLYVFCTRYLAMGILSNLTSLTARRQGESYLSLQNLAFLFRGHTIAEAVALGCVLFRLIGSLRVNRHIFLIWESLRMALLSFLPVMVIAVPVFIGAAVLAQSLWGMDYAMCKTFWDALTTTLVKLSGEPFAIDVEQHTLLAISFSIGVYGLVTLCFINSWVAVVSLAYQKTRVAAGYNPRTYDWGEEQWVRWTLWSPVARLYRLILRRRRRDHDET